MHAPKIAVLGEVLFDSFADGVQVLGGAPFNVAWHLQAFQQQGLFISRIGQDAGGNEVLSAMQAWGMNTAGMQRDPIYPTGTVQISLLDGEPHYSILDHQAYDYIDVDAMPEFEAPWLYHGSLAFRHDSAQQKFLKWRQTYQGKIFVDINLRAPWWSYEQLQTLLIGADWLKLNQEELHLLNPNGINSQEQVWSLIACYSLSAVVLTQAAGGAQLYTAEGGVLTVRPQQRTDIVDAVGAGDAFAAICLLGLMANWPQNLMLERAQEFASAILAQRGAIVTQPDFYQSFIRQWQI